MGFQPTMGISDVSEYKIYKWLMLFCLGMKHYPVYMLLLKLAHLMIVDLPIDSMVDLSIVFCMLTRG